MSNSATDVLQQLKDLRQPPPVSWWPLAPGWYILLGLILIIVVASVYYAVLYWRKARRRRRVLAEVDALREWFAQYADKQYVASRLSILLKQVLFVAYSPQEVAGLHGEDWLLFLDRATAPTSYIAKARGFREGYSQGSGRLLLTAPYATHTDGNLDDLFELVKQTIKRVI